MQPSALDSGALSLSFTHGFATKLGAPATLERATSGQGQNRKIPILVTYPEFDRLCVVLVSTLSPLNIGAAARAMSNFGFSRLRVVNPYNAEWIRRTLRRTTDDRDCNPVSRSGGVMKRGRVYPSKCP